MGQIVKCQRMRDDVVLVKVSIKRYRVARIQHAMGYRFGVTNISTIDLTNPEYITAPMGFTEALKYLRSHQGYTTPDIYELSTVALDRRLK